MTPRPSDRLRQPLMNLKLTKDEALRLYQMAYGQSNDGWGVTILESLQQEYEEQFDEFMPEPWEWED